MLAKLGLGSMVQLFGDQAKIISARQLGSMKARPTSHTPPSQAHQRAEQRR